MSPVTDAPYMLRALARAVEKSGSFLQWYSTYLLPLNLQMGWMVVHGKTYGPNADARDAYL